MPKQKSNATKPKHKPIDYIALGRRIRVFRKQQGMTQAEMGHAVGLSATFIGHIERGTRIPSVETLCRIAEALEVSVDALLLEFPRPLPSSPSMAARMRILNAMMHVLNEHAEDWLGDV